MSAGDGALAREPNRLLSAARHAHRLTQQQLAEAVNAAHRRLFGREAALDADHVSKLERGLITWPNKRYREAFRVVLGADTDAELGFYHRTRVTVEAARATDRAPEVDKVRRGAFIRLGNRLGVGAGLGVARLGAGLPDPVREVLLRAADPVVPGRVGRADVEQVRFATATFRSWREQYGGGACRDALAGQSCFHLALHCAEEARDWDLRAEALTDMSQQAVDLGQLDHAMSLIELAQVRVDRVSGTSRAMMSCAHARVLGIAGQVAECRGAVAVSEDYFANHEPVTESAESSYFRQASEGYLTLDNGHALFPLGLGDTVTAGLASEKLRAALGHPGIAHRRRAMGTAKLATLQLLHGDRDEGIGLAHRAIDLGGDMRSARLFGDLRRLRTAATRHTGASVDALRQQLDSVLVSG